MTNCHTCEYKQHYESLQETNVHAAIIWERIKKRDKVIRELEREIEKKIRKSAKGLSIWMAK